MRNTPVDFTEAIAPILSRRKEYREGSGGSGRHQGGRGQVIELAHASGAAFAVFALFDRIDHPARGRHGGAKLVLNSAISGAHQSTPLAR